jgi:erythromycin esterase-like protein
MKLRPQCLARCALLFTLFLVGARAQENQTASKDAHASAASTAAIRRPTSADQSFVDWIRAQAIPLDTVEAGDGFADMQPLKKVVGDTRIIALGEATHGTREFFQLKHRMIEFLADQMGFTIFSIEANMPEAYRLNDFVLNGSGDPKELLKGMYFWTWNTQEVLDLILWMREFNRSGKGHIEFTGFDMQTPTVSLEIVRNFVERLDAADLELVERTYKEVAGLRHSANGGPNFGVVTATFPLKVAVGKHIKYSGFVRTEGITEGHAGLWWRVDGEPGKPLLAFDNMQDRGAKGTTPWTRYEISLDVPASARNIVFGVLHPGNGTAWFDSLQVGIDGVPYTDTALFDLGFESSTVHGFFIGGRGYEIQLDKSVAHSGSQSLRSNFVGNPFSKPDGNAVDEKQLTRDCKKILDHLESRRSEFVKQSVPKDIDWAIQNSRLVLQFMQLKIGEKSRDESMAENVKWIADHSPGAKLVLWAHNAHVSYAGPSGFDPMGGYLRKRFRNELVNFGFAFNEGSFQAVEQGKSLHDFTVGPAPEGSLDRALAAAGIPLLALDLRQAPDHGPVAEWLSQSRASRSIGAIYSESNSQAFLTLMRPRQNFDVILFVEKTTAARGIHSTSYDDRRQSQRFALRRILVAGSSRARSAGSPPRDAPYRDRSRSSP